MPLFGGAIDADPTAPQNPDDDQNISGEDEQAAKLLLQISSPDVIRPAFGMTPIHRREEFSLDSGTKVQTREGAAGVRGRASGTCWGCDPWWDDVASRGIVAKLFPTAVTRSSFMIRMCSFVRVACARCWGGIQP
jgi:hypothetical protein